MEVNMSAETITTVYNSLRNSKSSLKQQLGKKITPNKKAIIEHQLEEVEDALFLFEELMETM